MEAAAAMALSLWSCENEHGRGRKQKLPLLFTSLYAEFNTAVMFPYEQLRFSSSLVDRSLMSFCIKVSKTKNIDTGYTPGLFLQYAVIAN